MPYLTEAYVHIWPEGVISDENVVKKSVIPGQDIKFLKRKGRSDMA